MVKDGAPAYLIMIDSLISKDPENKDMLATAALLYTSYADVFVNDPDRAKKMTTKALDYAQKAVCLSRSSACGLRAASFDDFEKELAGFDEDELSGLFALGNAWGGWIMANKSDLDAIADLSKIEAIMKKIIAIDETYKDGAPHLYLGSLSSFLPPALGGRPEDGKAHFEKAIELSKGKNLSAKVVYAKLYARMVFDRQLHDRLLNEVLEADPYIDGYTLVNVWAQQQAKALLEEADDYF